MTSRASSRLGASLSRGFAVLAATSCFLAGSAPSAPAQSARRVAPLDDAAPAAAVASAASGLQLVAAPEFRVGPDNEFEPSALTRSYTLANAGTSDAAWEARVSAPWLAVAGPAGGTLAPGASIDVAVTVDPDLAFSLTPDAETAAGAISFVDSASGAIAGRHPVRIEASFAPRGRGPVASGWTRFLPSADTRKVYVSNATGNDQNSGLSASAPKKTIAAGVALLRHGFPDWLLLERGNVWNESFGQWKKSGRSQTEPMLLTTYGSAVARPLLRTGTSGGMWTNGGGGSPASIDNLAVMGLHFTPHQYAGAGICIGAQMLQPGSHVLFEDCKFEGYSVNMVLQGYGGRHADYAVRRCVVVDAWTIHSIGGHSQGLYAYAVDGLLLEENVFDHNGWNDAVSGAGADIFSHNLYIDNDNTDVVVRGNLIANASSHGMQLRPGGTVTNNLFVRNSIALSVGGGNNPEQNGVTADVAGNVIIDGKNINASTPRGWGMWFANISSGAVRRNVIANNSLGTQPNVVTIAGNHVGDNWPSIGVHDLSFDGNVLFNWAGGVRIEGDPWKLSNIRFNFNDVQNNTSSDSLIDHSVASNASALTSSNNRFFSLLAPSTAWAHLGSTPCPLTTWFAQVGDGTSTVQNVAYPAPTRSPATFNGLQGGQATLDAFLQEARTQSSRTWRVEYMATSVSRYLRGGF